MSLEDYIAATLGRLEAQYHAMTTAFEPPIIVKDGSMAWFRYEKQSDVLLCFLKGVKLVSTLNAALVLLRQGYALEVGALCRMADDFCFEIMFMIKTLDGDKPSKDQERFFHEFFQEEFENPDHPLSSSQIRDSVPRRKIFAAFGQLAKEELNPSDAQTTLMTIHRTFSGYVHGAYPHIMEMYEGKSARFRMSGMSNTRREAEWRVQLTMYVYRAIMASELVSRKLGLKDIERSIRELLVEYETQLELRGKADPETVIRKFK
ncbi:MAG: hypothetical protein ORO03_11075 [Alphaproteobacteria bacterium]|nr:hypothetical protein [Alphaproteobacteria bacterium]